MREHRVQHQPSTVDSIPPESIPVTETQERNAHERGVHERGQAMVEYVLIIVLLAMGFGFALAITGPAIGNVFNNVLYQFVGQDPSLPVNQLSEPNQGGSPNEFWATVTWVAQYRQTETPFPTPVTRPTLSVPGGGGDTSTPSRTPSETPSLTPTNTATFTQTLTPSLTPTFTYTPSPGPSPTPVDRVFDVPHVDQMGNPLWWRLDRSNKLEELAIDPWDVIPYDTVNNYTSATAFTLSTPRTPFTHSGSDWVEGGITYYSVPAGTTAPFGARFTKEVTFITPVSFRAGIRTRGTDAARLSISTITGYVVTSFNVDNVWTYSPTINLPAGSYTFTLDYADNGGDRAIELDFDSMYRYNSPDDNFRQCRWDTVNDTDAHPNNNAISTSWMFAQDPTTLWNNGTAYAAGQTCYLEMRGYVDLSDTTQPLLSFWDYWHLPSSINAEFQISPYVEDTVGELPPTLNRSGLNWQTIALRTGGTSNYNWTRNQIDLSSYRATYGDKLTFRFVLRNTGGATSGVHRWFIDDLQILDDTTPDNADFFTINDTWDMDTRDQMDDFIFDGDSMRTLQRTGGVPNQINGSSEWRWDLTSTRPRGGGGMSWDDSPGFNHVASMMGEDARPRVSFLEFKYPINLTSNPAVPTTDINGNSGTPLLMYYTTYSVGWSTSIQLEYTFDPPTAGTTQRNWQIVPNDGRIRRAGGCTTCDFNELSAADITASGYRQIIVRLNQIPNWGTQEFYLRFALYAGSGNAEGWYIDDISFRRNSGSAYVGYPFVDDAEDPGLTSTVWDLTNGNWEATTERGSFANIGSYAYHDSVGGNYTPNSNKWMELTPIIDLNYDTPLNIDNPGTLGEPLRTSGAAVNPTLTFYHQRRTHDGDSFSVDIFVDSTGSWYTIWQYVDSSTHGQSNWSRTQDTWERVEIDLAAGLQTALGIPYATLISNGNLTDDDIRIRFRMTANNTNQANGIYIDNINISNRVEYVHKLWGSTPYGTLVTGAGDGEYEDRIEIATRTNNASTMWNPLTTPVTERWYMGGTWEAVDHGEAYVHSGNAALTDSPPLGTQYQYESEYFLEMRPVIDLRGTDPAVRPMLTFWSRYDIGDDDRLRVQIASESPSSLTQSHDKLAGWTRWEPARTGYSTPFVFNVGANPRAYWHRVDDAGLASGSAERRDTWQFYQVDLSSFVGNRIRIRFMLDSDHNTTLTPPRGDGWYIDDVSVRYGLPDFGPGTTWSAWTDTGITPGNWVMEGNWGITNQYTYLSSTEAFGVGSWRGFIFDCETILNNNPGLGYNQDTCDDGNVAVYNAIANNINNPVSPPYPAGVVGVYTPDEIDITESNFGTSDDTITPGAEFNDTFFARYTRTVTLEPDKVYEFVAYSDDGLRLRTSSNANMRRNGVPMSGNYIIEDWTFHSVRRARAFIEVTVPVTVTLTLEFFEGTGNNRFALGVSIADFSYTDSPNNEDATSATGYDVVPSPRWGNASLMLDGYFNLSGAPNRFLTYHRLWNLARYQNFYVDVSTDGGFTWTSVDSITQPNPPNTDGNEAIVPGSSGSSYLLTDGSWQQRFVQLPAASAVVFRFRVDTIRGDPTSDGVWIDQIQLIR